MPLLGSGVLAIWNGIDPEAEAEFVEWHVREHIPERVARKAIRGHRRRARLFQLLRDRLSCGADQFGLPGSA